MSRQPTQAVSVAPDAFFWGAGKRISELALASRIPSIFAFAENVEVGGLMSYGADTLYSVRRVATYIDKIFKGANPAAVGANKFGDCFGATKFEG